MKSFFQNLFLVPAVFMFFLNVTLINISYGSDDLNGSSSEDLEAEIAPVVSAAFNELQIPGVIVGVWMPGYEPYIAALGSADLSTNSPMSTADHMRVGSITKTMTATILLQLADEGKISLTDKLSKYFPDYPNGDNITIEEVGNMSSGLFNYTEDPDFGKTLTENPFTPFTPGQLIDIAKTHEPYFAPGKSFHYSNTNFILLGMIIEKITGNTMKSEIQKRIFDPLGMTNTLLADNEYFPDPHAHGYGYADPTSAEPTDLTNMNASWAWSAGSLISTLEDLKKYVTPLVKGELVSPQSHSQRLKWVDIPPSERGQWTSMIQYGFGITNFGDAIGHYGGVPGYSSFMGGLPEKNATVIVLVNMQDNKAGIVPADFIQKKIIEKLMTM